MTDETTKPAEEAPQREDPAVDPTEGESAITDVGTPSEHASEVVAKPEVATFGDPDPPPSREDVTTSFTWLDSTDVNTFTSSGIMAPASVPHVMMLESFHHMEVSPPSSGIIRKEIP